MWISILVRSREKMKTTKMMIISTEVRGEQRSIEAIPRETWCQDCLVIGVIYGPVVSYLYDFYDCMACLTGGKTQTHNDTL